jgi:hypothetical protein
VALPSGWPSDFPLPDGAVALSDESDADVIRVRFTTPSPIDLEAFFLKNLIRGGWRVELLSDDSSEAAFEIEGHGFFGQVELPHSENAPFSIQLV